MTIYDENAFSVLKWLVLKVEPILKQIQAAT